MRLVLAAALVTWGARTDRAWTVAIAAMLGLPDLWPHGLVLGLAALPALRERGAIPGGVPGWQVSGARFDWSTAVAVSVTAIVALLFAPAIESIVTEASWHLLLKPVPGTPQH